MSPASSIPLPGSVPQQFHPLYGGSPRGRTPRGGGSPALLPRLAAGSPPGLALEGFVQGRCLSAPSAWKAPHVQAPRSRLRRFPAMNWASESEPPARLPAQCTALGAGDGCPPKSARTARVRARHQPASILVPGLVPRALWSICRLPKSRVRFQERLSVLATADSAEVPNRQRALRPPPPRGQSVAVPPPFLPRTLRPGPHGQASSRCRRARSPPRYRPRSIPRRRARSTGRPLQATSEQAARGEAKAPQSRGGEEGGGERGGREGRGSAAEGEGEGRGRPPQFAPCLGSDTQPARSRRSGRAAAAASASASPRAARAAGSVAATAAGRPRRAGLGSGCERRRNRNRSRRGSPRALGWAGLGRAQGAGAGARGKTHGRARLSRGAARDCTGTRASPLRAALGLAPGPGG